MTERLRWSHESTPVIKSDQTEHAHTHTQMRAHHSGEIGIRPMDGSGVTLLAVLWHCMVLQGIIQGDRAKGMWDLSVLFLANARLQLS